MVGRCDRHIGVAPLLQWVEGGSAVKGARDGGGGVTCAVRAEEWQVVGVELHCTVISERL